MWTKYLIYINIDNVNTIVQPFKARRYLKQLLTFHLFWDCLNNGCISYRKQTGYLFKFDAKNESHDCTLFKEV